MYTLWGSKPITEIVLDHYTSEESAILSKDCSKEELENCYVNDNYDLPKNWEKISSRFPMQRYMLFRSHFDEDGKTSFVYFVDIIRAAAIIQDNYVLFRQEVGYDFNPLQAILEMPNQESLFWKNIKDSKKSVLLWGLLFGYGQVNSYAFYWKYFDCSGSCSSFMRSFPNQFSNPYPVGQVRISLKNFKIPDFASFVSEDEMIT